MDGVVFVLGFVTEVGVDRGANESGSVYIRVVLRSPI